MKRAAPILWIVLGIAAIVYWSNTSDHRSTSASTISGHTAEEDTDDSGSFHGYDCTVDCSGHQAGYDWAEKHDIDDEDDCRGNSESFIEGCKAYVEEQEGISGDDDSDSDDRNDEP